MSVELNLTDKILAGVHHSFTITSSEGTPAGEVLIGGQPIPSRVILMRVPKWKISFLIPAGAAGKELTVRARAGASSAEETRPIAKE